jgi:AAA+ ATPase superfamily predicted ATPase
MSDFVGRQEELARLGRHLDAVRAGEARLVSVRGRRQVGKSRLISEFVTSSGCPQFFVTGSRQASLAGDLESFRQDAELNCTLPGADLLTTRFSTWEQALRAVRAALPTDGPSIVVLDELPWLLERDPGLDGTLQKLWDRSFEGAPVLMILIGSDLSVMEMLTDHGRPLFGRAKEMVINPLSVRDMARMAGLDHDDDDASGTAFDALLLTGGYPRLALEWRRTPSVDAFLSAQLGDENAEVITTGQRILDAEFPADLQASIVLRAVGSGERTFTAIADKSGIGASSLTRALQALTQKQVIAVDQPLSLSPATKLSRYRVADPYLRFWLRFVEAGIADVRRGRPDLTISRIKRDWPDYRGRAIEPIVREALTRLAADHPALGGAEAVGGWWPRGNIPEVDLVGIAPAHRPKRVPFIGSIKWRESSPFDSADLASLAQHRADVPGAGDAALVAVARRSGCTAKPDAFFSATDLLQAWP